MNDFSLNEAASSAARISIRKPAPRMPQMNRRRSAIHQLQSGSVNLAELSGSQSARRSPKRPHDALDLAPTLSRMAGIASLLPERCLDLGHAQASAAQIDPKLEECLDCPLSAGAVSATSGWLPPDAAPDRPEPSPPPQPRSSRASAGAWGTRSAASVAALVRRRSA